MSDVKNFCSGEKVLEKEGYEPDDSVLRGRLNNTVFGKARFTCHPHSLCN